MFREHTVRVRCRSLLDPDAGMGHNGGMKSARWILPAALAVPAAGCAAEPTPIRAYEARGVLVDVGEDRSSVVISHEAIANYMPAMEMPFPLAHPDVADGVEAGDEVAFHIVVFDTYESSIVHMEALPSHAGPFPAFALKGLDGGAVTSAMLEGRVAIVNFWASWCAPCREALPFYSGLHRELSDRGLVVLAVNVDEHVEDAHRFLEGRALAQPMIRDAGWQVGRRYGVAVLPAAVVIDRRGIVRGRHVGFDAGYAADTRALVLELLAEPAAAPAGRYTGGADSGGRPR